MCEEVALLPELEFRNWSGRYFRHSGWDVSGLFSKCPSPLQAKGKNRTPPSHTGSFLWVNELYIHATSETDCHSVCIVIRYQSLHSQFIRQLASLTPSNKQERAEMGGQREGRL